MRCCGQVDTHNLRDISGRKGIESVKFHWSGRNKPVVPPLMKSAPPTGDGWVHEVKFDGCSPSFTKMERPGRSTAATATT